MPCPGYQHLLSSDQRVGAAGWPIHMALDFPVFNLLCHHADHLHALFDDHLPEMIDRARQRALGGNDVQVAWSDA